MCFKLFPQFLSHLDDIVLLCLIDDIVLLCLIDDIVLLCLISCGNACVGSKLITISDSSNFHVLISTLMEASFSHELNTCLPGDTDNPTIMSHA